MVSTVFHDTVQLVRNWAPCNVPVQNNDSELEFCFFGGGKNRQDNMTPLKTLRLSRPIPGRDDIFLHVSVLQTLEVLDVGAGGLAENPRARMTPLKNGIGNLRISAVIELRIIVFMCCETRTTRLLQQGCG